MRGAVARQHAARCRQYLSYIVILAILTPIFFTGQASAANLSPRALQLSSSAPATPATYQFSVGYITASLIGSVRFEICENDPFIDTACTPPSGLDALSATLSAQTGETGFSLSATSTANVLILTRTPSGAVFQTAVYTFDNIINPSNSGSYYVRIQTYATDDATGPDTDEGAVAFRINPVFTVTTEVPPFVELCTGISIGGYDCSTAEGDKINFGELSRTVTRTGTSQIVATANAELGYTITLAGTTMASGNDVIPAMSSAVSVPGISQFGLNARANSTPLVGTDPTGVGTAVPTANYNQPDFFRFTEGEVIIRATGSNDYQKFTISYIVNVAASQPVGRYASTVSYICLANF